MCLCLLQGPLRGGRRFHSRRTERRFDKGTGPKIMKSWTVAKDVCLLWIKVSIIKQWQSFIVQSKAVFTHKWYLYVKHNNILSMAVLISWNNKISSKTSPMVYDVYLFRLTLKISSKSLPGVLLSCLSRGGSSQMTLTGPLYLLGEFTFCDLYRAAVGPCNFYSIRFSRVLNIRAFFMSSCLCWNIHVALWVDDSWLLQGDKRLWGSVGGEEINRFVRGQWNTSRRMNQFSHIVCMDQAEAITGYRNKPDTEIDPAVCQSSMRWYVGHVGDWSVQRFQTKHEEQQRNKSLITWQSWLNLPSFEKSSNQKNKNKKHYTQNLYFCISILQTLPLPSHIFWVLLTAIYLFYLLTIPVNVRVHTHTHRLSAHA